MAVRLSKAFGRTPEGWLQLQMQYDLAKVSQRIEGILVTRSCSHKRSHWLPVHRAAYS